MRAGFAKGTNRIHGIESLLRNSSALRREARTLSRRGSIVIETSSPTSHVRKQVHTSKTVGSQDF
jgi:hypothetical protein